ncbi:hypothetical protein D3C81_1919010 [compost metagenome]
MNQTVSRVAIRNQSTLIRHPGSVNVYRNARVAVHVLDASADDLTSAVNVYGYRPKAKIRNEAIILRAV